MSYEFEYLMQLVASAAHGTQAPKPKRTPDWQKLARLAKEQSVLPLVGCALKRSPQTGCPEPLRTELIGQMRVMAAKDQQRRSRIIPMLAKMEAAGIPVVLLKGYDAARAYAAPECRISSDVDLWVAPKLEKKACDFLSAEGFTIEPRWANGHHAVCTHPLMGCVELHVLLYDEIVEEIWFGKTDGQEFIREERRLWESADGPCYILGVTDDLIFMSLHMIKHFIQSGLSLRMLMDVALFAAANRETVDMERFWATMTSLHYEKLMQTLFWAAVEYLGVAAGEIPGLASGRPAAVEAVLDDLEQGGWLGFNDKSAREDGWYEYNRRLMLRDRSAASYKFYMLRWRFAAVKTAIRPGRKLLEENYPWLEAHAWLLPWAWLRYMLRKGTHFLRQGFFGRVAAQPSVSASGQERVQLFQTLDIL